VLVVHGHPRTPSLCAALADAYTAGARAAGHEIETIDLAAIEFDPDVHTVSPRQQPLEPDLERVRQLIAWAGHLVFVFPAWWGVGPARLQGLLDRVLLPGFAFVETPNGRFAGLLHGKTAHLVITMDMPPAVYRLIYRAPGLNAMKRSALGFCGVETTATLSFGPVKDSSAVQRAAWMERCRALGFSLREGPRSRAARAGAKLLAWVRALRLQFYPMTWMAYTIGALAAAAMSGRWDRQSYWLGYACLFFIEAATVFTNEWFDFETDRRNLLYGPFNGGSRVLLEGGLRFSELRTGIVLALIAAAGFSGLLIDGMPATSAPLGAAALGAATVLGLGYTAPPLRLAWRGLGELTVAFTHSFVVILCGHLLQNGAFTDPFPWLISIPLFIAVLPAIILSGVPDADADRAAGKRTLVVKLGGRRAEWLALSLVPAAALAALLLKGLPAVRGALDGLLPFVLPHAGLLMYLIYREATRSARRLAQTRAHGADPSSPVQGRINSLMIAALSYIVWFVLTPLWHLA
jgi:putative NADPH-quinone reductase/1,4-dihydroxy-2-naphthoate octaprenyltransferase